MGIELVLGPDLFVHDDKVFLKTTRGPQRVDVIYRRSTTTSSTPRRSGPTACSACPDLMRAYRAGNVTLANAVGTGVADDKAIYPFVEDMIRFYLTEEPILHNVPTYICARPDDRAYVLDHLRRAGGQGGQRVGRLRHAHGAVRHGQASAPSSATKIKANPRNYIAQPVVTLSTCPTWTEEGPAPRHVDLRPVHRQRQVDLGAARRPDAHGPGQGVAGGQLQPGRRQQGHLGDGERPMISRVAEHCFWMSRYLERAENTARVLEVNQTLLLDFDVPDRAAVAAAAHHQRRPRHAEAAGRARRCRTT